nr:hypothetical protein Iba_chr06aCG14440 [Ipomoea batatas]
MKVLAAVAASSRPPSAGRVTFLAVVGVEESEFRLHRCVEASESEAEISTTPSGSSSVSSEESSLSSSRARVFRQMSVPPERGRKSELEASESEEEISTTPSGSSSVSSEESSLSSSRARVFRQMSVPPERGRKFELEASESEEEISTTPSGSSSVSSEESSLSSSRARVFRQMSVPPESGRKSEQPQLRTEEDRLFVGGDRRPPFGFAVHCWKTEEGDRLLPHVARDRRRCRRQGKKSRVWVTVQSAPSVAAARAPHAAASRAEGDNGDARVAGELRLHALTESGVPSALTVVFSRVVLLRRQGVEQCRKQGKERALMEIVAAARCHCSPRFAVTHLRIDRCCSPMAPSRCFAGATVDRRYMARSCVAAEMEDHHCRHRGRRLH